MTSDRDQRDRGSTLVLTLLLTVVLASVVGAIAAYAATTLRSSRLASERAEGNAAASAGITWALEEFASRRLGPADCAGHDGPIHAPTNLLPDGTSILVACTLHEVEGVPTIRMSAWTERYDAGARQVDVDVQLPVGDQVPQVVGWVAGPGPAPSPVTTEPPETTEPPVTTEPPDGDVSCSFDVYRTWQGGTVGRGRLRITNDTSGEISEWRVRIARDGYTLVPYYVPAETSPTSVEAWSQSWNSPIAAGESATVMRARVSDGDVVVGQTFDCEVLAAE